MAYSERKLHLLMDGLGFEERYKGTGDIREAVAIISENPHALFGKDIYPAVAAARTTDPRTIERSIRVAIRAATESPFWAVAWRGIGGWNDPTNVEVVRRLARECAIED